MADVVLVTGYPSQLAREVCEETAALEPEARIFVLASPSRVARANADLDKLTRERRERITCLEGDASAIDLGLSGAELTSLAREVTRIHHCAGVARSGADRAAAERANVGGALEALEFAAQCTRLERLVFYSTALVSGDRTGVVLESELKAGQSFRSPVEETYARGEKMMRAAMDRLPVTVVRPTTIVGDSRMGRADRMDGPYLLILLMMTSPADLVLPLPARGDTPVNLVPVDWVARASVALGRDPLARGATYHLVDAHPPDARHVFDTIATLIGRPHPRGSIPTTLAKAFLRAPGLGRIANGPKAFLETLTTPVTYDATSAIARLAALGVAPCPPLDSYLEPLVAHVRQRRARAAESREMTREADGSSA
jgi:thioester reductase-like protein